MNIEIPARGQIDQGDFAVQQRRQRHQAISTRTATAKPATADATLDDPDVGILTPCEGVTRQIDAAKPGWSGVEVEGDKKQDSPPSTFNCSLLKTSHLRLFNTCSTSFGPSCVALGREVLTQIEQELVAFRPDEPFPLADFAIDNQGFHRKRALYSSYIDDVHACCMRKMDSEDW